MLRYAGCADMNNGDSLMSWYLRVYQGKICSTKFA